MHEPAIFSRPSTVGGPLAVEFGPGSNVVEFGPGSKVVGLGPRPLVVVALSSSSPPHPAATSASASTARRARSVARRHRNIASVCPITTSAHARSLTSRAMVDDGVLRVSRSCVIPLDELEWRFTGPGGPGGQHANTSNTRAEVRFDIATSPSLGPRLRSLLLGKLGAVARPVASDRRSQSQNRTLALERLRERIAD